MRKWRYVVSAAFMLAALSACAGLDERLKEKLKSGSGGSLDAATVAAGLREALEQGTGRAVQTLGRENGFWSHANLRIPVPEKLARAEKTLRRLGQDKLADDFIQSLNRAAEQATPAARDIFVGAIRKMTIRDAFDILNGPPNAATQYFRRHTETSLAQAFRPIVARSTQAVGVTAQYKKLVSRVEPLGVVDTRGLDLDDYVTRKAMDGLFQLVAEEEKRIREDPVARTTELLRKVFK
ncbi:MAG TPA: DUF4197 domain-containing protein [Burkholderiales bacterium]|nr:DUF4197 domain-containing protein [Burkholderiales bacterium]